MKIFSGNANPALAMDIAAYLGINLGRVKVGAWSRCVVRCTCCVASSMVVVVVVVVAALSRDCFLFAWVFCVICLRGGVGLMLRVALVLVASGDGFWVITVVVFYSPIGLSQAGPLARSHWRVVQQ